MKAQLDLQTIQAVMNILGELPARQVRGLLNQIEAEVGPQIEQANQAQAAAKAEAAVKAALAKIESAKESTKEPAKVTGPAV